MQEKCFVSLLHYPQMHCRFNLQLIQLSIPKHGVFSSLFLLGKSRRINARFGSKNFIVRREYNDVDTLHFCIKLLIQRICFKWIA